MIANVVGVAQLVRAPGCGSGGRGFKTHHPPHLHTSSNVSLTSSIYINIADFDKVLYKNNIFEYS